MALFPCGSSNGGGGGGGTYTTTVLFTNGASGDTTFQLSSAYTNFDAIAIYYSHFDGQDSYEDVRTYPTTFLNSVSSTDEVLGFTNDAWYYYFRVYSTTEFRYVKSNAGYITDIIGIKYGSNSGGGAVTGVKGSAESSYRTGNVEISAANIGLGNVDNTSDLNKPISTATQTALNGKVDTVVGKGLSTNDYDNTAKGIVDGVTTALAGKVNTSSVGSANGVAELDANGRVPSSQLPSYVDDVLEYADLAHFPATGEIGKIYIAEDTNKTYRWSGSNYAEISESLALGETSSTAYAGNKGKANADAIAAIKDGTNIDSFADVESAISVVNEKADTFGIYTITNATDIKDFIKKVITQADADLASKPAYKIYHIFSAYQGLDNFYGMIERQNVHGYSFVLNAASGNTVYQGYCDISSNYLNVYRYVGMPIGQATLGTGFIAAFHDGNSYRCFVPFPFWASDSNYTITLNGVSQVNVGNVLASASVETKYRTGFVLTVSGTYDYSKCGIAVNYTVTLN